MNAITNALFRVLLPALLIAAQPTPAAAQTIGGIVNRYATVRGLAFDCEQTVVLDRDLGLMSGDRLLLIQMQGVVVDTVADVGRVTDLASAGLLTFATVHHTNGMTVVLDAPLDVTFDLTSTVQAVTVPVYRSATVTTPLRAKPWDGATGGVLTIDVVDTLTLRAPITVSGVGFRGGRVSRNGSLACGDDRLVLDYATARSGEKGEGLLPTPVRRNAGRGHWAGGGGGGNDHNGGGGGGANGGAGGMGGRQWDGCPSTTTGAGLGGATLPNVVGRLRAFMGAGGGGGHENNGRGSAGAAGGGIAIIRAGTLVGNNDTIGARGATADTAVGDGGGGGGAGGTVLLDVVRFRTAVTVDVRGGDGGAIDDRALHGPGGGGSGGRITHLNRRPPAGITHQFSGGRRGGNIYRPQLSGDHGSTDGDAGSLTLLAELPTPPPRADTLRATLPADTTICVGLIYTARMDRTGGTAPYDVLWVDGRGAVLGDGASVDVRVLRDTTLMVMVTDSRGCRTMDTMHIDADASGFLTTGDVDLGVRRGCDSVVDTVIVIRNPGQRPVVITALAADLPATLGALPLPHTVDPGDSVVLPVRLDLAGDGPVAAVVRVTSDGCIPDTVARLQAVVARARVTTPDTVFLPDVLTCLATESSADVVLTNVTLNGYAVDIANVTVEGDFVLERTSPLTFLLRWRPVADGVATGTLAFRVLPCGDSIRIPVVGRRTSSAVTVSGDITMAPSDERGTIVVRNTGSTDCTVASATPSDAAFVIVGVVPPLPAVVPPGDSLVVYLAVDGRPAVTDGTVELVWTEPCAGRDTVRVSRLPVVRTTVVAPRRSGAPGDAVLLPIVVRDVTSNVEPFLTTWVLRVRLPRTSLAIDAEAVVEPDVTVVRTVEGTENVLTLSGTWDGRDTLATVRAMVAFDANDTAIVDLDDTVPFRWTAMPDTTGTTIVQIDGLVDLRDAICVRPNRMISFGMATFRVTMVNVLGQELASFETTAASDADLVAAVHRTATGLCWAVIRGVDGSYRATWPVYATSTGATTR